MAIDISKKQKEKIYKEFDEALYREFNEGLDDLRAALDIDEQGLLDEALEGTFEDGGPKELRKFIDDLMKICFRIREERNKLLKQKASAHKKAVEQIIDNILIKAIDED